MRGGRGASSARSACAARPRTCAATWSTAGMRAETEVVGAPTGGMDQTVAMLGEAGSRAAHRLRRPRRRGPQHARAARAGTGTRCWSTDTRVSHALVDGGYGQRRADCEEAVAALGVPSLRRADLAAVESLDDERVRRRARHIVTEIDRVRACVDVARPTGDLESVGALFAASHVSMRDDFEISCPELDVAVAVAVEAGAVAARMTGGGFGGSSVAVVPDERLRRGHPRHRRCVRARGLRSARPPPGGAVGRRDPRTLTRRPGVASSEGWACVLTSHQYPGGPPGRGASPSLGT